MSESGGGDGEHVRRLVTDRRGDPPPLPAALPEGAVVADAHCHLDLLSVSVSEAVAAAASVGVSRLVTIGVDLPSSRWAADTAAATDSVAAAVAIHPNETGAVSDEDLRELSLLASRPEVRAVGETGLDHFRTGDDGWAKQEASFRAHIRIAKASGKALVIHDRDAHDDVLRILLEEGAPTVTVFHCFSGDASMARICADRGYFLSFAGNMTFKNAGTLREAAAVTPRELLLVETDAPFLTPIPHRGAPNSSYLIPLTLRALAEVRGDDLVELAHAIDDNSTTVFGSF